LLSLLFRIDKEVVVKQFEKNEIFKILICVKV